MEIAVLIVVAIAIAIAYFKLRRRARRREAAINIILAKTTFLSLRHDDQIRVHDRAVSDLNDMMGDRFKGFYGEYDQFGAYAHAMAHLGIAPVIKDYCYPRWYLVNNPFFDIQPDDPLIEETAQEVKRKHGVNVSVSKEHRLFDKIRKAKQEADQPKTAWDALQENPIFQDQRELFEAMSKLCEDGVDADQLPNGRGEFGMVSSNPIPCKTVFGSTSYLGRLRAMDGTKVLYERSGSVTSDASPHPIDVYEVSHQNGKKLAILFISPYQKRVSNKPPRGFQLALTAFS